MIHGREHGERGLGGRSAQGELGLARMAAGLVCVLISGAALAQTRPSDPAEIDVGPGISATGTPQAAARPTTTSESLERALRADPEYRKTRTNLMAAGIITGIGVTVGLVLVATPRVVDGGGHNNKSEVFGQMAAGGAIAGASLCIGASAMLYLGNKMSRIRSKHAALQAAMIDVEKDRVGVRLAFQF